MSADSCINEVVRQLSERKSVRAFTNQPIPEGVKEEILRAATEAPTAGNQQLYTILDITDPDLKTKLVDNYYCNKAEPITEYTHKEQLSKYCPNCGCRMKGAEDDII